MAAPSFADLFNTGKTEAQLRRPELTFDQGDISEMLMAGGAAMADHLLGYVAERIKATFLDGASGDDLTTLADDHWGIQRIAAVAATGLVTFTRAAPGAAGTIPTGTVVATARDTQGNEIQFATTAPASFLTTDLTKTVAAAAVVAGVAGNVAATTITRIVSTLFESTFSVSNAARFAGGAEQESDEELRDRVRQFPTTLRRGTAGALVYGAKTVAGVKTAVVVDAGTGLVTVYIADANGGSSPQLVDSVATELENWRAAGIPLTVLGGSVSLQNVNVSLTLKPGTTVSSAAIVAAITARMNKLSIGETLTRDAIKNAVTNVDPYSISAVTVNTPGGDVVPSASQIIRPGTVTVS